MGGQNHQPCNHIGTWYLYFSTKMSKALSLARKDVEQANASLEDVLLNELGKNNTTMLDDILNYLQLSIANLQQVNEVISLLRSDMQRHNFVDLPTRRIIDFESLGNELQEINVVENESWEVVSKIMDKDGFYGILDIFTGNINNLIEQTQTLKLLISETEVSIAKGTLSLVLEENRSGNFKVEFAQLYNTWLKFQQVFLASSMLSTELWYRYNNTGSLLMGPNVTKQVV